MAENKKIIEGTESIATRLRGYTIYYIIVGIFIIFAIFLRDRGFLSVLNIMNIFRQTAMISVMAVGFTFVLASGEIDLSIGSTVALASLIGAVILRQYGMTLAVLLALGVGAFVGFLNGVFTVKLNMPSFLVTIAMMSVVQGFARWITHLAAIPVTDQRFAFVFGNGNVGPVSTLFIWTIVVVFIGHLVISKTSFGRKVLAAGGNKTAAIFSGINVGNVKWLLFIIMGILAALAGLLYTGRMLAGRYDFGQSDLLTVIAAVIIGGNSISGGKGTVIGALVGSVILGMINNGLILFGLSLDQQIIFRGVIILVAVALSPKET
jgi:ribose transport system permease protein